MCPIKSAQPHWQSGATLAEVLVALLLLSLSLLSATVLQWQSLDASYQALLQSEQHFLESSRYELQHLGLSPEQIHTLLPSLESDCDQC